MRLIDRLQEYLKHHHLNPYTFERACGIANGYLKKQFKGRGSMGSDILEKITDKYRDLNLIWLVTGQGSMLLDDTTSRALETGNIAEEQGPYTQQPVVQQLNEKIAILENSLNDKEKIIRLLEQQLKQKARKTDTR